MVARRREQRGVIRTNCMDCLDRTNVVQSVIGRRQLHRILADAGIGSKQAATGAALEKLGYGLEETFRNAWTNNADAMSILYSGTPALKTDFTRLGKRTVKGSLNDGVNSVKRYFLGNFYDNVTQDKLDLSLGKLNPKAFRPRQGLLPGWLLLAGLFGLIIYGVSLVGELGLTYFEQEQYSGSLTLWAGVLVLGGVLGMQVSQAMKGLLVKRPLL